MQFGDAQFHKISSLDSLFGIFQQNPKASYILNGGNTAHGKLTVSK